MRAFSVTWRALVSYYSELFLLAGLSAIWWATGGVFLGAAIFLGYPMWQISGPWWLAPLLAIPIGPATLALANATRRAAASRHLDRSFFWEEFRTHWRQGLAIGAIGMGVLAVLLLNVLFYFAMPQPLLKALGFLFIYLAVMWVAAQLYVYPIFLALEEPGVKQAVSKSVMLSFANPLFSAVLIVLVAALGALSALLALLLIVAWPAVMSLMGQHALRLILERAGLLEDATGESGR